MKKIIKLIESIERSSLLCVTAMTVVVMIISIVCKLCGCGLLSCAYAWGGGFVATIVLVGYKEWRKETDSSSAFAIGIATTTAVCLYSLLMMM